MRTSSYLWFGAALVAVGVGAYALGRQSPALPAAPPSPPAPPTPTPATPNAYAGAWPINLVAGTMSYVAGGGQYSVQLPPGAKWANGATAPVLTASPQGTYNWIDANGYSQTTVVQ